MSTFDMIKNFIFKFVFLYRHTAFNLRKYQSGTTIYDLLTYLTRQQYFLPLLYWDCLLLIASLFARQFFPRFCRAHQCYVSTVVDEYVKVHSVCTSVFIGCLWIRMNWMNCKDSFIRWNHYFQKIEAISVVVWNDVFFATGLHQPFLRISSFFSAMYD